MTQTARTTIGRDNGDPISNGIAILSIVQAIALIIYKLAVWMNLASATTLLSPVWLSGWSIVLMSFVSVAFWFKSMRSIEKNREQDDWFAFGVAISLAIFLACFVWMLAYQTIWAGWL